MSAFYTSFCIRHSLCVKDAISVSGSVMPSRLCWGMMFLQRKAPMDGDSLP